MIKNYKFDSRIPKYKNYLKNIAFGTAVLFAVSNVQAQVGSYTFAQSNGTYSELTSGTVLATATTASAATSLYNQEYNVTMPFTFNFDGANFNNLKVSSNGYISFGGTASATGSTPISGTEDWYGSVSAWGRSLNAAYISGTVAGNIKWDVVGTAPNREMVIQWSNFKPVYSTSTTNIYKHNFQIRLKETTNEIVTSYNPVGYAAGTTAIVGTAEIGLRGASNLEFNNRENASTLSFNSSTAGTAGSVTQYFSTSSTAASGMPSSGLTYTWTPPTCFAPNFTTNTSTSNSITVNWTAPIPAPNTYEIYYSTSNTPPTATTVPSQANIAASTYTINNLTPYTNYYIWVRSNCGGGNSSVWSSTMAATAFAVCTPATLDSVMGGTFCSGQNATLSATSNNTNATINWYDSNTSTTPIATGNSYTTSALTATTDYWASASQSYNTNAGVLVPKSTTGNNGTGASTGLVLNLNKNARLNTVDIYPYTTTAGQTTGTVTIALINSSGATINSGTYNVSLSYGSTSAIGAAAAAVAAPNTISLGYDIPAGSGYKLVFTTKSAGVYGFVRENTTNTPTYPMALSDIGTINTTTPSYYYYFYNLNLSSNCESARQQVTATLDSACLGTSEISKKEEVKIYPNPFNDIINISDVSNVKSITVSDISGRTLRNIEKVSNTINLSDLSTGLYIINIQYKDGHKVSTKMIKK